MNNQTKAEMTLDDFFRTVYEEVGMSRGRPEVPEVVDCIVVSDCAVAFARTENSERDDPLAPDWSSKEAKRLVSMLTFVENVALKMINREVAIRGSIAHGPLKYMRTLEGPGLVKAKFSGKAYLNAYTDAERGLPELKLGQVRIRPRAKVQSILGQNPDFSSRFPLHLRKGNFYFYWMLRSLRHRPSFDRRLTLCYEKLYDPIISLIKCYAEVDQAPNIQTTATL